MSAALRDRISGVVRPAPPGPVIPGQWLLAEPGALLLNRQPVKAGDYLVPDGRHGWQLAGADGVARADGRFEADLQLSADEALGLSDIAKEAAGALESPSWWPALTQLSPLLRDLSERARLHPLERDIARCLGYLRRVCERPRLHLKSEEQRVPTARARRIPARATDFLAAHSEDWAARTVRGVRPRRLLATINEDELDLYENRVAVRLVDHLLRYVSQRIAQVEEAKRLYLDAERELGAGHEGTHWRQRRLYELWGRTDAAQGARVAEETLRRLDGLRRELLRLQDSPLYRGIPERAQVATTLRQTNILRNDAVYRKVAWLWRRWAHTRRRATSPRERFELQQALCEGFERFGILLTCRALAALRMKPAEGARLARGGPAVKLEGPGGPVELQWREDGSWCLSGPWSDRTLRFVCIPAKPAAKGDPLVVRRFLDAVASGSSAPSGERRVILYFDHGGGAKPPNAELALAQGLAEERRKVDSLLPDLLPISPADLQSEERLARALRAWLTGALLRRYPPQVQVPRPVMDRWAGKLAWAAGKGGTTSLRMIRPPSAQDRRHLQQLLEAERMPKVPGRRELFTAADAEACLRAFDEGVHFFKELMQCPICPTGEAQSLEPQDGEFFLLQCPACESQWGLRACGNCPGKIPMLWPQGGKLEEAMRSPGWVDRMLGRDVVASPCWRTGQTKSFICPSCRICPNEGRREGECVRCQPRTDMSAHR